MRIIITAATFMLCGTATLRAEIKTEEVEYTHDGQTLNGFIAWDDAVEGKRPGVLVVHEWWGLNDYARRRATMLAELGYVAFAADMYGEGKTTEHPQEAGQWATQVRQNQSAWRERGLAGLKQLAEHPLVDTTRMAAIGYCFGGSTVLQLNYAGADLKGVVSFHGALSPADEGAGEKMQGRILVCHGANDAFIPDTAVQAFRAALDREQADYQIIYYGGARHSFTSPEASARNLENIEYNQEADERSWIHMQVFFDEIFAD